MLYVYGLCCSAVWIRVPRFSAHIWDLCVYRVILVHPVCLSVCAKGDRQRVRERESRRNEVVKGLSGEIVKQQIAQADHDEIKRYIKLS